MPSPNYFIIKNMQMSRQPLSVYNPEATPSRATSTLATSQMLKKRDLSQQRHNMSENMAQLKYEEIKKKYGSKERSGADLYESAALKEISLRHSNYNSSSAAKNLQQFSASIEKKYDLKASSIYAQSPQSKFLDRRDSIAVSAFTREDHKQISGNQGGRPSYAEAQNTTPTAYLMPPTARPKNTRLDTSTISRSIQRYVSDSGNKERQKERVGSIDKINMKIYQILNCLSENSEKREVLKSEPQKVEEKKISEQIPVPKHVSFEKPVEQRYRPDTYGLNNQGSNTRSSRTLQVSTIDRSRRYSLLGSLHDPKKLVNSGLKPQQSRRSNSIFKDRDIDEEIRRIQQRIKSTEEKKRKLNISCQEWKENEMDKEKQSSIPKRVATHSKGVERSSTLLDRKNRLYNNSVFKITETDAQERVPRFGEIQNTEEPNIPVDISKVNLPIIKQTSEENTSISSISHSTNRAGMRNLAINNIKSSVFYHQQPAPSTLRKPQTKRLIEALKDQVSYDERLRNAKLIFSYNKSEDKNEVANEILVKNGIVLGEAELKKEIEITLEEHNPFFSVKECNQPIEQLIAKYVESWKHWNERVEGKFSQEILRREGFSEEKIDLEKKGTLSLEDLVRFLNIETGNFYRNRDVVLIFRRIAPSGTIQFAQFMKALCS